jgi:hypothetical protein
LGRDVTTGPGCSGEVLRGPVRLEFEDVPGFKTENGLFAMGPIKAAWFKDSEGNILEISEVAGG